MPAAVIPAVSAAASLAGGGMSAAGGKKAAKKANDLAQQQFQLQSQIAGQGMGNVTPAAAYFKALLSGDPTQIAQAVGPTSDILKQQGAANSRQLAATMPQGGEANAAQAANSQGTYNQMARLYAGVQPGAASALGQLGSSELGVAAPNVGTASKAFQNQAQAQNQKAGQLGTGIGQTLGHIGSKGGSSGGPSGAKPGVPAYSTPSSPIPASPGLAPGSINL